MDITTFSDILKRACEQNSISELATPQACEHLFCLYEFLVSENKKYNLTAITEPEDVIYKHFVDSLLISQHISENQSVIDVGCGAGFPSLPLAIARPDLKITSLDSTNKKITYIQLAAQRLGLENITAICGRAEEMARKAEYRDSFDISTARAVANFPILCELCLPFVKQSGQMIAMKSQRAAEELDAARNCIDVCGGKLSKTVAVNLTTDAENTNFEQRNLIIISKANISPKNYPRHFSKISKKPL
jgi:16S rRNA (guanine(527)-N(7))-methyltransferase RsmG